MASDKSTLTRIDKDQLEEIRKMAEEGNRKIVQQLRSIIASGIAVEKEKGK